MQTYDLGALQVLHADLWRINDPRELSALALDEAQAQGAALLIEWAEHGATKLPKADLQISLAFAEDATDSAQADAVQSDSVQFESVQSDSVQSESVQSSSVQFDPVQFEHEPQNQARTATLNGKLATPIITSFNNKQNPNQ